MTKQEKQTIFESYYKWDTTLEKMEQKGIDDYFYRRAMCKANVLYELIGELGLFSEYIEYKYSK